MPALPTVPAPFCTTIAEGIREFEGKKWWGFVLMLRMLWRKKKVNKRV